MLAGLYRPRLGHTRSADRKAWGDLGLSTRAVCAGGLGVGGELRRPQSSGAGADGKLTKPVVLWGLFQRDCEHTLASRGVV